MKTRKNESENTGGNVKSIKSLAFVLLVPATLASATPTPDQSINVTVINQELANMLKSCNDSTTKLGAGLYGAAVDSQHATYLKGYLSAVRLSTPTMQNKIVPAALGVTYQYQYAEGQTKPEFDIRASLVAKNGSMNKILLNTLSVQPNQMDSFFLELQKEIRNAAQDLLRNYGSAAKVTTRVSGIQKDKANHYVAESLALNLTIDTSRLPAHMSRDEIMFSSVNIWASLNLNSGVNVKASVLMNPDYTGFHSNQTGLKQYIEGLENSNPSEMRLLLSYAHEAKEFVDAATTNPTPNKK